MHTRQTLDQHPVADAISRTALAAGALALAVLHFVEWMGHRRRQAEARRQLARLSDHELSDIGLTRRDVDPLNQSEWNRAIRHPLL